jgi:hypothetical protein
MAKDVKDFDPNMVNRDAAGQTVWHDGRTLPIEGKGFADTDGPYCRLPARAKGKVSEGVWHLSHQSAGMSVRFETDATAISARWKLADLGTVGAEQLAMSHMAPAGVSGLDLYIKDAAKGWRWVGVGRPEQRANTVQLVEGLAAGMKTFRLYLPLYNALESLEIGVPGGCAFGKGDILLFPHSAPPDANRHTGANESNQIQHNRTEKLNVPFSEVGANPQEAKGDRHRQTAGGASPLLPVVYYGTSITQGGCASRPGMAYTSIVGRRLDCQTVNLGFSGCGQAEIEMADVVAEVEAAVYVVDCLGNVMPKDIQRVEPFVRRLRHLRPDSPVVLVEQVYFIYGEYVDKVYRDIKGKNVYLHDLHDRLLAEGWRGLYYVDGKNLLGHDGEACVDGVHPTDLGMLRMAEIIAPIVKRAIACSVPVRA